MKNKLESSPNPAGETADFIELLAAFGINAESLYDGDGQDCPHCVSTAVAEAA
jgi:hypothetical protein